MAYCIYARYEKNPRNSECENCDQVLKFSHFGWGCLTCNGSGKQTNRQICMNLSFKKNSMSLGLVVCHAEADAYAYTDADAAAE